MFDITIGNVVQDNRYLNKIFTPEMTLQGTLKDESSIISPTIIIQASASKLARCNYVSIPAFNRYYYITDVTSINSTLCEISLKCDVLFTYSKQIMGCVASIDRNENSYNPYLDDEKIITKYPPAVITTPFPNAIQDETYVIVTTGGWT